MAYYNNYNYQNYGYAPQPPKPNFLPLIYVNGIEGAKGYIVEPNSTVFLMDSEGKFLIRKSADNFGKPYMEQYEIRSAAQPPTQQYATTEQLAALQKYFDDKLAEISKLLKKGEDADV